jgi:NADPH:quinone reductase-like Zn-dependent oxidoreductase
VGRTYPLDEAVAALEYLESGHAQGKVVLTMMDPPD